jgi:GNAT superfamily N-acetyltransferase
MIAGTSADLEAIVGALDLPQGVTIRAWTEADFPIIQQLSQAEGWTTPLERPDDALEAWRRSWPTLVAVQSEAVIGFSRSLSDGLVTTYVAELLVAPPWRCLGIASALLDVTQQLCPGSRLDLLSTATAGAFYQQAGFRAFPGFRRSWAEGRGARQ